MTESQTAFGKRNDEIRTNGLFGPDQKSDLVVTPSIADLGEEAVGFLTLKLMQFSSFDPEDDPYGNHDFGVLDFFGEEVLFKIDQKDGEADERVITLLLPSEH